MNIRAILVLATTAAIGAFASVQPAIAGKRDSATAQAEAKATVTVAQMTPEEKVVLTQGIMPLPFFGPVTTLPADAIPGAGYVAGIARLGIPALKETDASLGVSYVGGIRKDGATALPSGVAMAASWNPDLLWKGGAMIGAEARAKGFNVLLAGGVNLMREPRNGRTFEYLSEDPLLSGVLVGAAIAGIQSNDIISTIKHYALNDQETGRQYVDIRISEPAARESDLLAFQIGIERGRPGSVMCAYNRVNGHKACDNDWLLNKVLKRDWGWKGFVMSDWGAVPGLGAAINGLDQQSGAQLDQAVFFGDQLRQAAARDPAYATRLDDMNKRVLTAIYAAGVDTHPATPGGTFDKNAHAGVAQEIAQQGIVLLRNNGNALPLAKTARRIAVIGGYADSGVLSGAGSSQVHEDEGPAVVRPLGGQGAMAALFSQQYQRSNPLRAIRAQVPGATVTFRDGRYLTDAVETAKRADVVIVFANQWTSEGMDVPDLSLPDGQDELIAAVAAANPHTIVVLQTGGPVTMPWLDKTAAVIEAWYPGARGGEAIASVLFGDINPGGRLPITFPASIDQLPRKEIEGLFTTEPNFMGTPPTPDARISANYDNEGSDVGYRWFARKCEKPLFPFGFGLSYTTFVSSGLNISGMTASLTVTNTGQRAGDDVAQVYLVSRGKEAKRRLVGFQLVSLLPGASQKVTVTIDPRLLADWQGGGWSIPAGDYAFALGRDAETLSSVVTVKFGARHWKD